MQGVQNLFTATDVHDYTGKYTESGGLFWILLVSYHKVMISQAMQSTRH